MMRAWMIVAALLASLTAAFGQSPPFPTTLPSNTVVGNLTPVTAPGRAVSIAALQAAVLNGGVRAITGSDTILTSDLNKTLYMTGALGTLTVPSAANFPAGFTVSVLNGNTTRGQKITGLSNVPATAPCSQHGSASGTQCILYPLQTIVLRVVSSGWAITKQAGPWMIQAGQTVVFNVDPATGSDSNDGLATGSGNAFATVQHCVDTVISSVFLLSTNSGAVGATGKVKCKLATQTNTEAIILRDCQGDFYRVASPCIIEGDNTTPGNVAMKGASVGAIFSSFTGMRPWFVTGVACSPTSTSDDCFLTDWVGHIDIGTITIPTAAKNFINARYKSSVEILTSSASGCTTCITIAANLNSFASASDKATVLAQGSASTIPVTITGTPAWGSAFVLINDQSSSVDLAALNITGSATGVKATIVGGSSGAANPSSYPGNSAVVHAPAFAAGDLPAIGGGDVSCASGGNCTIANSAVTNAKLANSATTVAGQTCTLGSTCGLSTASNNLTVDVNLNNTGSYFDGPSMAQGTTGTWFASGTVTLLDTAGGANFSCKLWDGTTVMASTGSFATSANQAVTIHLAGFLASPAANIRISCNDSTSTSGKIKASVFVANKDSTIYGFRIN